MTKQEQIEEMAKIVDEMYNVYTTTADDIADGLYNAGYRKTFTSDLASDTQKAFKEGYEKAQSELKTEIERLKTENCELTKKLEARLTCDFVKTAQKQAQIEVLNRLKSLSIYDDNYLDGYVFIDDIEKLLEELKK